jgi:hypothetical protein
VAPTGSPRRWIWGASKSPAWQSHRRRGIWATRKRRG